MNNNPISFTMLGFGNFVCSPSNKGFKGLNLFKGYQRVDLVERECMEIVKCLFFGLNKFLACLKIENIFLITRLLTSL
jgi:hypothetical protein